MNLERYDAIVGFILIGVLLVTVLGFLVGLVRQW